MSQGGQPPRYLLRCNKRKSLKTEARNGEFKMLNGLGSVLNLIWKSQKGNNVLIQHQRLHGTTGQTVFSCALRRCQVRQPNVTVLFSSVLLRLPLHHSTGKAGTWKRYEVCSENFFQKNLLDFTMTKIMYRNSYVKSAKKNPQTWQVPPQSNP